MTLEWKIFGFVLALGALLALEEKDVLGGTERGRHRRQPHRALADGRQAQAPGRGGHRSVGLRSPQSRRFRPLAQVPGLAAPVQLTGCVPPAGAPLGIGRAALAPGGSRPARLIPVGQGADLTQPVGPAYAPPLALRLPCIAFTQSTAIRPWTLYCRENCGS